MRIAVVGFGVAGATAAALLAGQGHEVVLLERAPELGPAGAGALVQPSGQRVLERLGVLDEVRSRAARIDELVALTPRGRLISRMRYGELYPGLHALGVERGVLFAALAGLVEHAGVEVRLGIEVSGMEDVRAHGMFDLVVGADGSRSALRAGSGLVRWEHEYEWGALWAVAPGTAVTGRLHQVSGGTRLLIGVLPLGGGRCNLFWSVRRSDVDRLRRSSFERWRAHVATLCREAAEPLAALDGWSDLRFTTYRHAVLRKPFADGLVLVGDAAHPMSPHLGQGINLALVDAWQLAAALRSAGSLLGALERYAALRRRQIAYYSAVTLGLTPFFQSGGVVKGFARDAALPLLPHVPLVKRRVLVTLCGLADGPFRRFEL